MATKAEKFKATMKEYDRPFVEGQPNWIVKDRFVYLHYHREEWVTRIGCQDMNWALEIARELNDLNQLRRDFKLSYPDLKEKASMFATSKSDWKEKALGRHR